MRPFTTEKIPLKSASFKVPLYTCKIKKKTISIAVTSGDGEEEARLGLVVAAGGGAWDALIFSKGSGSLCDRCNLSYLKKDAVQQLGHLPPVPPCSPLPACPLPCLVLPPLGPSFSPISPLAPELELLDLPFKTLLPRLAREFLFPFRCNCLSPIIVFFDFISFGSCQPL